MLKSKFAPMTRQERKAARTEVDTATSEYLARGSTVTHCKTTSTPAWLIARKKRAKLNIVSTADLLGD